MITGFLRKCDNAVGGQMGAIVLVGVMMIVIVMASVGVSFNVEDAHFVSRFN